jgi:hypothetical protein
MLASGKDDPARTNVGPEIGLMQQVTLWPDGLKRLETCAALMLKWPYHDGASGTPITA